MKKVRMLLRVSSDRQLESDGDLSVQRKILVEFIGKQKEWILDKKEYFEGSKSAYKNTASQREVLQEILQDAENQEFDILVPYKDDRVGRLMWDTPQYVMKLKELGVAVYTVKDGCISPETDDIMGQMMLTFRYANAQKSSADTGMRVKDTAQKLVEQGRFMGGRAPYGYRLEYSGQISKHGRALKHLVMIPEQAEAVRYIYALSLDREYGSAKIAKELNCHPRYAGLAPNDKWKSGTIASILTNPIYAGHTAYKRRERKNGKYCRLDSSEWVISDKADESIQMIEETVWNRIQDKRKMRSAKYGKKPDKESVSVIRRNNGLLPLIDVLYCGYCGRKLTNGSNYHYWIMKDTGEKQSRIIPAYRCQNAVQGIPHAGISRFRADRIEPMIFGVLAAYVRRLQEDDDISAEIEHHQKQEEAFLKREADAARNTVYEMESSLEVMKNHIPEAMSGTYPLSLEELVSMIHRQEEKLEIQRKCLTEKELAQKKSVFAANEKENLKNILTWQDVFFHADMSVKRVIVNRLIEQIQVTKEEILIRFKSSRKDFFTESEINGGFGVPKQGL